MNAPTIIEEGQRREAAKAKWFRHNVLRMSVAQLAHATGYSGQTIQNFERGYGHDGKRISPQQWTKYRLACAGLTVPDFDWGCSEIPVVEPANGKSGHQHGDNTQGKPDH